MVTNVKTVDLECKKISWLLEQESDVKLEVLNIIRIIP